jgi:outer membrane protein assembly factor BamB
MRYQIPERVNDQCGFTRKLRKVKPWSQRVALQLASVACALSMVSPAPAGDLFLMGDRVGYGIVRTQGEACFAVAPSTVASGSETLHAMLPGVFRLPAEVVRIFDAGIAIVRVGDDGAACDGANWEQGENLEATLERTGIGALQIRLGDGTVGNMHVHVDEIDPAGFFISPLGELDRLMEGMVGSRILLEGSAAGMLLSVDEAQNRGRVIRQDELSNLIAPFFDSLTSIVRADVETESTGTAQTKQRPEIVHRFFIGKQTWRNNPTIVGNRVFVGSAGLEWNKPDALDGVYSFNLDTGEQIWFVHTDNDANDLTYINGLVVVGTDSGEVLGIGARSGKTDWKRKFDGKVYARPVHLPMGVAVATSVGGLYVLNLKDGVTRASSRLDAGVRAGLVAAREDLWIATESGTLYRYVGFGDVQIRRRSRIFYPDALGKELSGVAIDWYERLGQGRGTRAKFYAAPLVLDDRVILSVVREGQFEYPPVMAFATDGGLDWIGTDPDGYINSAFGDSRLTPASWFDQLILVDPYSNSIYSMSSNSGEVLWAIDLGHPTFQHWASPVVENDYVYVARHDGFVHKLQANDGKRVWSMYFGQYAHSGKTFLENEPLPKLESAPIWSAQLASPIFSTPAVSDNTIVVGTDEGYLYIIKDTD